MQYSAYHFKVDPPQPGSEILMAMIADMGFESFDVNETGFVAYINENETENVKLDDLQFEDFKYSVKVETLAVEGSIFEVINQVAKDIKATLMVLGTHGKKGLQHVFGSYALRVVIDSPVPVIVVQRRHFRRGYHDIVFPISNELEPRQKVQWTATISKLFNSKIHLFCAIESDAILNNRLKIITSQITKVLNEKAVPYSLTIAEKPGDFGQQVINYSSKNCADLIIIMTEPNYDIQGFSYSKWSEALMFNEAQMPVMCINPFNLGTYYYELS